MLKNLPSLSNLPVSLPEGVRDRLAQVVGSQAVSTCPWIALSLVHASYLNEHLLDFEKARISVGTLNLIDGLGAAFGRLALFHLAYENPQVQTLGDADNFVAGLKKDAFRKIAEGLRLADVAFVGKGTSSELGNSRSRQRFLSLFGRQFLGAVRICSNYKTLFSLVETSVRTLRKAPVPASSYKSELLEYSQGQGLGLPQYEIIGETGPDHNKLFYIRVRTRDGRWAEGEGHSKKRAEKAAARQYMEKFASDYLAKKTLKAPKTDTQKRPFHVPPELHRGEVEDLCKNFEVPSDKMWLLSQALVHGSFLNETSLKDCRDNGMLAQLGSQVLIAIAIEVVVSKLLKSTSPKVKELPAGAIVAAFCDTSSISRGFDFLELEETLLVGRGQSGQGLTDRIKADAFQAVLAAIFIVRGTLEDAETFLPSDLFHWLTSSIERMVAEPDKAISPKDKFQRRLQAIGMTWEYRTESEGPDHDRVYRASIKLSSPLIRRGFILKGGKGRSRKEAESRIALLTGRAIDEANFGIGIQPTSTLLKNKGTRSFASFMLRHEFASAPKLPQGAKKWHKEGMLGSQLLAEGKFEAFSLWANAVESLLCEDLGEMPNLERMLGFYKAVRPISDSKPRHLYREGIATIGRLFDELDPEKRQPDVRQSCEFSEILSLSKISRLLSRERKAVNLSDILGDFLLLRQGRSPVIQPQGHFPDLGIWEREGTYQAMLNEVLALLDDEENLSNYGVVSLSVVHKPEKMALDFNFKWPCSLKSTEETQRLIDENALWGFLRDEIPITSINISPQEIHIRCGTYFDPMTISLSAKALQAYQQKSIFSKLENEAMSRLLHNLKNQLIAYQVSLDSSGADRTSLLKSRYEASRHLDNAISVYRSLEAIGRAMDTPTIEPFDVGEFFRQYIAEKITAVPPNIRIAPPRTVESCEVWTAPEFLRSIIENLVKNSVEAMPDGGEIRLDWVFDQTEESLLIEVADTGPGIDDSLLELLLAGEPVESAKEGGSGIGILTVKTMLQRIGGAISVETAPNKGTCWTIILPSLEETDESIDLAEADKMETLLASETEADLQ